MKLGWKRLLLTSFMLFSLFFGAGNLIFPPFLGQNAGNQTPLAFLGFFITAVLLPILGVVVVAKFDGLESLGRIVDKRFALIFTLLIYLSIGPGLGIPRAASVPFEMAVAPYLPDGSNLKVYMVIYSAIFFAIALWLCLTPGKLVKRIGYVLTPSLLTLLIILFSVFCVKGQVNVNDALGTYQDGAFLQGFCDGYQTMDAVAALNFGLVIALTLNSFGIKEKKSVIGHTVACGAIAGSILTFVYFMLAYMGAKSSGVYAPDGNGAVLLRLIVEQVFGLPGAILLAAIFTLACLTTCVGLINSISSYFSMLFTKVSYKVWVIIITLFSFLVCNLGLNTILSISVPILNIIYPISIVLIFFGLTSKWFNKVKLVYPITVWGTTIVSVLHSLSTTFNFGAFGEWLNTLPLFKMGFFWVIIASACLGLTLLGYLIYYLSYGRKHPKVQVATDGTAVVNTALNDDTDNSLENNNDDVCNDNSSNKASMEDETTDNSLEATPKEESPDGNLVGTTTEEKDNEDSNDKQNDL